MYIYIYILKLTIKFSLEKKNEDTLWSSDDKRNNSEITSDANTMFSKLLKLSENNICNKVPTFNSLSIKQKYVLYALTCYKLCAVICHETESLKE